MNLRDTAGPLCNAVFGAALGEPVTAVAGSIGLLKALLPKPDLRKRMDNLARRIADALPEGQEVGEFETGTAQALVRTYLRSVEDLTAAENDSYAAADRVLARGNSLLRHASDAERGRVRTMVVAFLDALRQDADVIREVRDELGRHDRRTLTEIAERVGRQDEHAAALQHLLAHWIVRDVLYEPAADLARVERGENLLSSHLLGTIYEVVPFRGRTAELDALRAFREGAGDVGALVIEGEGGIGKTRLAMEAVYHAQRDRWQAGFLVRDQSLDTLRAGLAALNEGEQPVFVVVDYAEDRPEQLAALVAEWLAVPGPTRRVILLVRSKALLDQRLEPVPILDNRLRPAVDFLRGSLVQPLGASDLRLPPEEREPAFLEARQAFATRLGRPIDGLPALTEGFFTSAPEHAHFGLLLFLHMAALASLDGPPSVQRLDLIRYVLNRNWAYVTRLLDDDRQLDTLGIRQEDLHDVLTVATLVLAARPPDDSPRPDARDCLAVTDLGAELANRVRLLRDLARFLTDVFPGEASDGRATLDALRPDVLGEGLVFDTLNRRLELLDAVLAMDEASITSACVVLVRTALAHGSDPDTWLSRLLPLDRLKTAPAVAAILHDAIHPQSVGLARLAVDLAQIALDETIGEGEETDVPRSARLHILANRLSALGRREDALAAAEEAVAIRRRLAARRPDAFEPYLATSLGNLGNRLSDLGRREDALAATEETAVIWRRLAPRRPDAFEPYLATSLSNLGVDLSALGRREDALAAAEEAVAIRRRLAARRPDAFEPDLAASLNNLGNRLSDLGRQEDAFAAAEEAAVIWRRLAARRPDAFEPDLARSLSNLGNLLSALGRQGDALAATGEAVAIRRRLAARRPDAFEPYLATSLNNLGNRLSDLGRQGDALAATGEAVAIRRRLAARRPDAFEPDLARSLGLLGMILALLDRSFEARGAFAEQLRLIVRFVIAYPKMFDELAKFGIKGYKKACISLNERPDHALLGPIMQALNEEEE